MIDVLGDGADVRVEGWMELRLVASEQGDRRGSPGDRHFLSGYEKGIATGIARGRACILD